MVLLILGNPQILKSKQYCYHVQTFLAVLEAGVYDVERSLLESLLVTTPTKFQAFLGSPWPCTYVTRTFPALP